jgi:hypothetical protein
MITKFLLTVLSLGPMFALDATSEIAQVREALSRANAAHDADAFAKLITPGYYATTRTGTLRDRDAALAHVQDTPPADLKVELIKTVTYGDTVIQTNQQSWTANDGTKHTSYVNEVFVKQGGSWKLAARFGTDIPPAK